MKKHPENLLAELPTDCIRVITQYCDLDTILTLTKTNIELRSISTSDETWEILLKDTHRKEISRFFQKRVGKLIKSSIIHYNKPETIDKVVDKNFPKPQLSPAKTIRKLKDKHSFFKAFCNTNKILKSYKPKKPYSPPPYENLIIASSLAILFGPFITALLFDSVTCFILGASMPFIFIIGEFFYNLFYDDKYDPRKIRRDNVNILKKINESEQTLVFTDINNIDPDSEEDPCDKITYEYTYPDWD